MSVTLKLEDRDAKLVAVGLDSLAEWYLGLENSPVARRLRGKFPGTRLDVEFLRLSAAFETAWKANVR